MKKILKFAIVAIITSFGSLQAAEFEGNIALSSEYMWRGMTQSDGEAAVSGGFDISGEKWSIFRSLGIKCRIWR